MIREESARCRDLGGLNNTTPGQQLLAAKHNWYPGMADACSKSGIFVKLQRVSNY